MSDLLNQASLVMVPSGYKEDTVYSVIPTDGSGDLSFTRASNGTRVNSAGLVEVCPWNLLQYSEDFTNAVYGKNSGSGGTIPIVTANYGVAPNGTTTADRIQLTRTTATNSYSQVNQDIVLINGATYNISVYLKSLSGTPTIYLTYNGTTFTNPVTLTSEWVRYTVEFTANSSTLTDYFQFIVYQAFPSSSLTADFLAWGAQLNIGATAKPYFPTTDRLNVPRLTYQNGGGGCPSLLLEKQSTNLLTYSEQFDNADWQKIATSLATVPVVTANYAISPDGTQNADRVQFARTGTTDGIYSLLLSNTCNLSATGTFTMYVKSLTSSTQNLLVYWGGGQGSVFQVTTEWTRITLSNLSSANQPMLFGTRGGTGNYYSGGDLSLDIAVWGAQLEASSYPTSYIPTTSSTATRVADACYKTGISSLIGQTEGVMFVDFKLDAYDSLAKWIAFLGGSNYYIGLYTDGNSRFVAEVYDNAASFVSQTFTFSVGQRYKLALAYKTNDFAFYVNGTQIATDNSGTVPATSQFSFEYNSTANNLTSRTYNQAVLFKTRLTNAELASITSL